MNMISPSVYFCVCLCVCVCVCQHRDAALEDPPAPPTTAKRVQRNRSVNEARRIVAKECEPRLREMIDQ